MSDLVRVGFLDQSGELSPGFGLQPKIIKTLVKFRAVLLLITGGWGAGKSDVGAALMALALARGGTVILAGPTEEVVKSVMLFKLLRHIAPFDADPLSKVAEGEGRSPAIASRDGISNTITMTKAAGGGKIILRWYGGGGKASTAFSKKQGYEGSALWASECQALTQDQLLLLRSRVRLKGHYMPIVIEGLAEYGTGFCDMLTGSVGTWFAMDTRDNPHIPAETIDDILSMCPAGMEDVYLRGLPVPKSGRVISNYDSREQTGESVIDHELDPSSAVILFGDFGFNNPYVGAAQGVNGDIDYDPLVICREWVKSNIDTETLWRGVFQEARDEGWAGSVVSIVCDPAGVQSSSKAKQGRTDIDAVRAAWRAVMGSAKCPAIRYPTVPRLKVIREGCAILNGAFKAADGYRDLYLSSSITNKEHVHAIRASGRKGMHDSLMGYGYKVMSNGTTTDEPVKDNIHDHATDSARYLIVTIRPTKRTKPKESAKPVHQPRQRGSSWRPDNRRGGWSADY